MCLNCLRTLGPWVPSWRLGQCCLLDRFPVVSFLFFVGVGFYLLHSSTCSLLPGISAGAQLSVAVGIEGFPILLPMDIGFSSGARCCLHHLASPVSSVVSLGWSGLLHPPPGLTPDSMTGCSSRLVPSCRRTLGFR